MIRWVVKNRRKGAAAGSGGTREHAKAPSTCWRVSMHSVTLRHFQLYIFANIATKGVFIKKEHMLRLVAAKKNTKRSWLATGVILQSKLHIIISYKTRRACPSPGHPNPHLRRRGTPARPEKAVATKAVTMRRVSVRSNVKCRCWDQCQCP